MVKRQTWGSSNLFGGYNVSADKGKNYRRIVLANRKARQLGISYGKYMAGLWEARQSSDDRWIKESDGNE